MVVKSPCREERDRSTKFSCGTIALFEGRIEIVSRISEQLFCRGDHQCVGETTTARVEVEVMTATKGDLKQSKGESGRLLPTHGNQVEAVLDEWNGAEATKL